MQRDLERHSKITSYRLGEIPRHYDEFLRTLAASSTLPSLREVFSELLKHLEDNLLFDHLGIGLHDPARNTVSVILHAGEHEFPT